MAQEHFNMGFVHLGRVDFRTVKSDKPDDPFTVGLFCAISVVLPASGGGDTEGLDAPGPSALKWNLV
jgi:hypothetical protein